MRGREREKGNGPDRREGGWHRGERGISERGAGVGAGRPEAGVGRVEKYGAVSRGYAGVWDQL